MEAIIEFEKDSVVVSGVESIENEDEIYCILQGSEHTIEHVKHLGAFRIHVVSGKNIQMMRVTKYKIMD